MTLHSERCLIGRYPICSTLDKQRICVNTQLKSSKKQLKWNVCVQKSNSNDRYAIKCNVIVYNLVHIVSIPVINKWQSSIDFFLLASTQYHSSLWIKYRCPVQYFAEKHNDESETLQSVHTWMSTRGWDLLRYNNISYFDALERQTMGVNKYASTFAMASCKKVRKRVMIKQNVAWKNIWKYAIVFASTQLRIIRLRKYPIDPKAYLGRCYLVYQCLQQILFLFYQPSGNLSCGSDFMCSKKKETFQDLIEADSHECATIICLNTHSEKLKPIDHVLLKFA